MNTNTSSKTTSVYEFKMTYKELVKFLKEKGMPEPHNYGIKVSTIPGGTIVNNYDTLVFSIKRTERTKNHI